MVNLDTYRTDSVARRALAAFMPTLAEVVANGGMGSWFGIVGSTSNNMASTIKAPDFDCVCYAQLGNLEEHNLKLECKHDPRGTVYYRLRFVGSDKQKSQLEEFFSNHLSHLVCYSKYKEDPLSVPWLVQLDNGEWYLNADNIRTLQEGIGDIIGAVRSETGAAATAVCPVDEELLLEMYEKFRQRLEPETGNNRFFNKIIPELVVPYFAREYRNNSLDFDLVTLICCKPCDYIIESLKKASGLPIKVEEQMRSLGGICLTTKVDKTGVGNKKVDLCLSISHDNYLKKFQGCREVMVILKDLLAMQQKNKSDSGWPKSYHLKTVMANILEKQSDEMMHEGILLKAILQNTIKAYEDCHLPSFFDPRINLLLDLKAAKDKDDQRRISAIDAMRHVLDNHEKLLQECHKKPMELSKLLMGMIRRVLNSDVIDWQREFSGSLLVFNYMLKLADLGYHDHTEETTLEANVNNALLKETFAQLATDSAVSTRRAFLRSVQLFGQNYAANALLTGLNSKFKICPDSDSCAEGGLGEIMEVVSKQYGRVFRKRTKKFLRK